MQTHSSPVFTCNCVHNGESRLSWTCYSGQNFFCYQYAYLCENKHLFYWVEYKSTDIFIQCSSIMILFLLLKGNNDFLVFHVVKCFGLCRNTLLCKKIFKNCEFANQENYFIRIVPGVFLFVYWFYKMLKSQKYEI